MQTLVFLTGCIINYHAWLIQWNQDLVAFHLMNLPVYDMRGVDGANLPSLTEHKVRTRLWFPLSADHHLTPLCRSRKQVHFKVLGALLPTNALTALLPIEEHIVVVVDFVK